MKSGTLTTTGLVITLGLILAEQHLAAAVAMTCTLIAPMIVALEERLDRLDDSIARRMENSEHRLRTKIDALGSRLSALERFVHAYEDEEANKRVIAEVEAIVNRSRTNETDGP